MRFSTRQVLIAGLWGALTIPSGALSATRCDTDVDCVDVPIVGREGHCIDSYCCLTPCEGGRCDVPGVEGHCIDTRAPGSVCTADTDCVTGHCYDGRCCFSECEEGDCDNPFGACVQPLELGQSCRSGSDCASGICDERESVCCSTVCSQDETCNDIKVEPHGHCVPSSAVNRPARCRGDCNGDGVTSINELVAGAAIILGQSDVSSCWAIDADRDGSVAVGEIVRAAKVALGFCSPRPRDMDYAPNILGLWRGSWNAPDALGYGTDTGGWISVNITQQDGALKATGAIGWDRDPTGLLHWTGSAVGTIEDGVAQFSFDSLIGSGSGQVEGPIITGEGRVGPPLLDRDRRRRGFSFTGRFVTDHYIVGAFEIAIYHSGVVRMQRIHN